MKTHITTLANKLKIVTTEMPGARSATAMILVAAGGRTENFDREGGVSHILEHMLFKGSVHRPTSKQISQEIDAVGGINGAYTTSDTTGYFVKLPKQQVNLALEIMADMVVNPLLEDAEIDRERGVIIEEINWRRHDDPMQLVSSLVPPLLWPVDRLGQDVAGNEEVIRTIGRRGVLAYKNRFYQPNNMVVSVAGGVSHEVVVASIKAMMGTMTYKTVPKLHLVKPGLAEHKVTVYTKPTAQANFIIGARAYPYWHKHDAAMSVLATVLGNGMSSRLFINIRERKGLAYDIGTSRQNFVDTGMFEVYAAANTENVDEAIRAVLEELELIQNELVPEEELNKAKNKLKGGLAMAMESNNNVADRFGTQLLLLGKVRSVEDAMAGIERVTAREVMRVAQETLSFDKLRMAIVASDGTSAKLTFEEIVGK